MRVLYVHEQWELLYTICVSRRQTLLLQMYVYALDLIHALVGSGSRAMHSQPTPILINIIHVPTFRLTFICYVELI